MTATLSEQDCTFLRQFLHERAALALEAEKCYLVQMRLQPLARRYGVNGVHGLVELLRRTPPGPLHEDIVSAMTTNETSFFRDGVPFVALAEHIVPTLLERRARERRLTIWSAASSSGQEPYSIAMTLLEHFPQLVNWDVRIVATDISAEMVRRTEEGRYSQVEVDRGLPRPLLLRYFTQEGSSWRVRPNLSKLVVARRLNLAEPWFGLPMVDVVFMRNVLIYFDMDTKRDMLNRLRTVLRPDGYLCLGSAETTLNLVDEFVRLPIDRAGYYRIRDREVA